MLDLAQQAGVVAQEAPGEGVEPGGEEGWGGRDGRGEAVGQKGLWACTESTRVEVFGIENLDREIPRQAVASLLQSRDQLAEILRPRQRGLDR